jgi:hypothetical protein
VCEERDGVELVGGRCVPRAPTVSFRMQGHRGDEAGRYGYLSVLGEEVEAGVFEALPRELQSVTIRLPRGECRQIQCGAVTPSWWRAPLVVAGQLTADSSSAAVGLWRASAVAVAQLIQKKI